MPKNAAHNSLSRNRQPVTQHKAYCHLNNGISLQVTTFTPVVPSRFLPVIMVPGLFSIPENFSRLLPALTGDFKVYYVETREKSSSICRKDSIYSIENMASDLNTVLQQLGFADHEFLLLGYSMGATVVMEALSAIPAQPAGVMLVGPSVSFGFPDWSLRLAKFAAPYYRFIKPLLKGYIRFFHVNHKEDPEMHQIQKRVLDAADPYKLCATVLAISGYSLIERLVSFHIPLLIVGASKDIFHNHDDALRLSEAISHSSYVDLETNQRNHSSEVVDLLKDFFPERSAKKIM
jgi:pimeloyl-ACP methyl ester carboxylesterase